MINVVCGIRSTGRICTDLATALEAQGHEVKIAYGREKVPDKFQKYAVKIGSDLDVKFHGVKARLFDGCGWGSKKVTKRFVEWVKEYNPDVIHLHNLHGYYVNLEVLFDYLRVCDKRIIWTLHDCWAFTGHTAYCDVAECKRWISGCYDCPIIGEYPASLVDRSKENWQKKKALMDCIPNLTIVVPSEWLAGLVRKSFLAQYPVVVIHNGIDTKKFHPVKSDFKTKYKIQDKFLLLGVASVWDEMKGFSDYLKVAEFLDDNYQLVMVGVTKHQKEKLPSKIIGIEKTNNVEELVQIYSDADLFLNLSYCENYPTVNLEATACGTPVLTYKTGGSPECARGGIIVDRGNIEGVIDEIIQYRGKLNNNNSYTRYSEIDNENTVKRYLEQYQ